MNGPLQVKEEVLGLKHKFTLDTLNNLAVLYYHQGKLVEAERLFQRAIEGMDTELGSTHQSTLNTLRNLSCLYAHQGNIDKAIEIHLAILQEKADYALGPLDHPVFETLFEALDTGNNLGVLFKRKGDLSRAKRVFEAVLEGCKKVLGPYCVFTYRPALRAMVNLGSVYESQGKMYHAKAMYKKASVGRKLAFGIVHPKCKEAQRGNDRTNALEAYQAGRLRARISNRIRCRCSHQLTAALLRKR